MKKTYRLSERKLRNIISESVKSLLKEYIDSTTPEFWDMFYEMTEKIGGEGEMLNALARAMGGDALLDNLRYIDRVYDLDVLSKYEDDYEEE